MCHLAIRGEADHVVVGLEELDSQQPVMVGRLFPWRDSEPVVVGVEVHAISVTTGFAWPRRFRVPLRSFFSPRALMNPGL
jgi:hypothetical protein